MLSLLLFCCMNDLCEAGDEMTDQYQVCNIRRRVLHRFAGNSMLVKINITCNNRYSILIKLLRKKQMAPYLVKTGDFPRI